MTQPRLCLLAGLILLLPLMGHTQWTPDEPYGSRPKLIQLIDDQYRHPLGMGFLFELDLGKLPKSVKADVLQPVSSLMPEFENRYSPMERPRRGRNPLMGLFFGIAAPLHALTHRPQLLPLPYQPVIPLDSGVAVDEEGTLHVVQRPLSGRIRLFIPYLMATDGHPLFLVMDEGKKERFNVMSPVLHIPRTIPDITLALVDTEPGRYLGAQGQWVRVRCQPPAYLASEHFKVWDMRPRIQLNGAYHVPRPDPEGPEAWKGASNETDTVRCFVPDALARADGSIELELMLAFDLTKSGNGFSEKEDLHVMTSRNRILLQGRQPTQRLRVRFIEHKKEVRPAYRRKGYKDMYCFFMYTLGGIRLHASEKADDSLSTQKVTRWRDPQMAEVPLMQGDGLGIQIYCTDNSSWFAGGKDYFIQLLEEDFPRDASTVKLVKKRDIGSYRYRWTLRAEYEWLDGQGD